jgi:DMSO/TMAO reductase YedYZ molybdopterin-dependent catalytic subunit
LDRRRFLRDASSTLAAGLLAGPRAAVTQDALPAGTIAASVLDAHPGKRPLIKRTFRPPNYETPVAVLREPYTPNDAFYVRWHMGVPDQDPSEFRLLVDGPMAQKPRTFTLADLRRFRQHEVVAINQCSGNRRGLFSPHVPGVQWGYGAMGNARWSGVALKDVLEAAGIAGQAMEVAADGADAPTLTGPDFVKSLPMWKALDADTLIALEMNGQPLSRWHGAPARLVVPGWTATYWVKSLTRISILDRPFDGFWMKTAYRVPQGVFGASQFDSQDSEQTAPITAIRVNSLIIEPEAGVRLRPRITTEIQGYAWDDGSGIRAVECSTDFGITWREARLMPSLGRYAWTGWGFELAPTPEGSRSVWVRATSRNGAVQPDTLIPNPAGYHHNVVQKAVYDAG